MTTIHPDFLEKSQLPSISGEDRWTWEGGEPQSGDDAAYGSRDASAPEAESFMETRMTYVLDTSVLLSDPLSLTRFA